ncbi:hypothetical protein DFA_06108 [Cavenderia fasciculata]|uniref:Phytanoyl-CoA dioxygenase n=1 Tax=Cavenderia fasciculata TaxID=261658 RepID=F4PK46_CACFS|nr:uncharacterized protein DFA_06108 [Cavenderia fasciculata]EGG23970.1 hypothetical protein DFA_06108 [Cavenderia fasciculata]|eukprot:XP_004361821.1 hypothetical protein DFA_06108 [Cavenderia fasciculata]
MSATKRKQRENEDTSQTKINSYFVSKGDKVDETINKTTVKDKSSKSKSTTTKSTTNNKQVKEVKKKKKVEEEEVIKKKRKKMSTESIIEEECNKFKEDWPEWRKHLYEHGWAVVPKVVAVEQCEQYRSKFWDWLEGFKTGIKRNSSSSWTNANWPSQIHGIFQHYALGQEQFVWDIRSEQAIIDVFTQVYNTDQLLVSFDGGNLSRPGHSSKPWAHFDQGSSKMGFRCIQGFLNLMDCQDTDGGLVVYDKSHLVHDKFFTESGIDSHGDWYKFDEQPETLPIFKNCKMVKVNCNVGDVVLWDSRTIHYAVHPTSRSCRMVVYVSYQPASLISEADLRKKQQCFYEKRMTSHWASENIKMFPKNPRTYGDKELLDRFKYDEETLPVLTPRARLLAGLDAYPEV